MKNKAVRYEFTPEEMRFFIFGKKICPKCSGKLTQHKGFDVENRSGRFGASRTAWASMETKIHRYTYSCNVCAATFTLAELAAIKR